MLLVAEARTQLEVPLLTSNCTANSSITRTEIVSALIAGELHDHGQRSIDALHVLWTSNGHGGRKSSEVLQRALWHRRAGLKRRHVIAWVQEFYLSHIIFKKCDSNLCGEWGQHNFWTQETRTKNAKKNQEMDHWENGEEPKGGEINRETGCFFLCPFFSVAVFLRSFLVFSFVLHLLQVLIWKGFCQCLIHFLLLYIGLFAKKRC